MLLEIAFYVSLISHGGKIRLLVSGKVYILEAAAEMTQASEDKNVRDV